MAYMSIVKFSKETCRLQDKRAHKAKKNGR